MDISTLSDLLGFICSIISIFGASFTILTYVFITEIRKNFYFYLVFHLSIADFGVALTGLSPVNAYLVNENVFFCDTIATLRTFFIMGTFMLNFLIAFTIFMAASSNLSGHQLMRDRLKYIFSNYIICIFMAIGPLITNSYGPDTIFCWITPNNKSVSAEFWIILDSYIILPSSCIGIVIFYWLTIKELRRSADDQRKFYTLFIIPLVFIFCNISTLINRIWYNTNAEPYIELIHVVLRQSQGWIHSLIYAFAIIKEHIFQKWREWQSNKKQDNPSLLLQSIS